MVESASSSKNLKGSGLYDFSEESNRLVMEKFVNDLKSGGSLSEAEMKFLSLSKEKRSSAKLLDNIFSSDLTLNNYEKLLGLDEYTAVGGTVNPEQAVRNIRYKDKSGAIVAIVQIDTVNKKIRLQNLGNILPKQECFSPSQVGTKIQNLARYNNWSTEDGSINQFNGNSEVRYKDKNGNVMAAILTKDNGRFDTIVEYEYNENNRSKMILTNNFGNSIVVYDGTKIIKQTTRLDVDNDGTIIEITKVYTD